MPPQDLLASLNAEQRDAVTTLSGPLLVLAGAGSGKTRVITTRIAHLMQHRVAARSILAMTFTNKAAKEMRERVSKLVGPRKAKALTVGTFHAFCLKLLREYTAEIGFPRGFSICDAADQLTAHKKALRALHVPEATLSPANLAGKVSLLKSRLASAEAELERAASPEDELVARAWIRYQEQLTTCAQVDFDDLLLHTVRLLRSGGEVREILRKRFQHVLVDEYQDTNAPQYEILRALAGGHKNLCVVGDDDQSIYGWRGADVNKILNFDKDFPGAKVVRLETNYRSSRDILGVANRLIANNPSRHEKTLRSHQGSGELVQAIAMRDENIEAEQIVAQIAERVAKNQSRYADFAILFRTATQPRPFEAELRMKQIPYVLIGGQSFFDRKEVRDILAYLRVVANPLDETSLLRVINAPPRGIGKTSIERVVAFATAHGISAAEAFERADEVEKLKPGAVDAVQRLRERLNVLGQDQSAAQLAQLVQRTIEAVGYRQEVERHWPEQKDRELRWAAVMDVVDFADGYAKKHKDGDLAGFLAELSLTAADSKDDETGKRDAVTLMTLHASKGLEFPRVYLVGMEEGLLPHLRAVAEDGIEEERRLTYVGVTRAREALTLTHSLERSRFGQRGTSHPSRFLFEIKGQTPPADWVAAEHVVAAAGQPGKKKKKKAKRKRRAARGKML